MAWVYDDNTGNMKWEDDPQPDDSQPDGPQFQLPDFPIGDSEREAIPPFPQGPSDNRPEKPTDPGDGRVYIWNGSSWVLTEPINAPFGPPSAKSTFNYEGGPQANFSPYMSPGPFTPRNATFSYQPFSYEAFKPSSWEDAEKEPGYQQAQDRLAKMVQSSAAYKGVLRSGSTIGDLSSVLDANKSQNFQQFDTRNFRNWGANRDNAFGSWSANLTAARNKFLDEYGIDKDIYSFHAQDVDRNNNYNFNTENASLQAELQKWTAMVNSLTSLGRPS